MPYLAYLFCEQCGVNNSLDIDHAGTINAYIKEGRKEAFINQATIIWDYLVYYCPRCHKRFVYTYPEVEKRVREYFTSLSKEYKDYFDKIPELQEEQEEAKRQVESETLERIAKRYTYKD